MHFVLVGHDNLHPWNQMIEQISHPTARDWNVRIVHTLREGNRVVDHLANLARKVEIGLHILVSPPRTCGLLLNKDINGVSLPRRIPVA